MNKTEIPIIIGDVHSAIFLLKPLLNRLGFYNKINGWVRESNYFLIFLGDLNDYRDEKRIEECSFIAVLELVKELSDKGWAICLTSNHQDKLIRCLNGSSVKNTLAFTRSVMEFRQLDKVKQKTLFNYLVSLPYCYYFTFNDVEYVCSHAYWDDFMQQQSLKLLKQQCLYGPTPKGEINWWESYPKQSKHVIVGHHHVEYYSDSITILDGGCGEGGSLLAYRLSDKTTLISN